jgi:hypothetical protein
MIWNLLYEVAASISATVHNTFKRSGTVDEEGLGGLVESV